MQTNTRLGIVLMCATTFVFAVQDGISRHLAGEYNVLMIVMIRYWFFAAFVITIATRQSGSIRAAAATRQPLLQIFRGALLAGEICVMVAGFVALGLVESHAVFACYPLLIAALSGAGTGRGRGLAPLGRHRHRLCGRAGDPATGLCGFRPRCRDPAAGGVHVRALRAADPLCRAAGHHRHIVFLDRHDRCCDDDRDRRVVMGTHVSPELAVDGRLVRPRAAGGHWLLIRTYEVAEASAVQPFAYLQLGFASLIGIFILGEVLRPNVAIGAAIVVSAGPVHPVARKAKGRLATAPLRNFGDQLSAIPL